MSRPPLLATPALLLSAFGKAGERRRGPGTRLAMFLGGTVLGTSIGVGAGALIGNGGQPKHDCGECGMSVAVGGAIGGLAGLVSGAVIGAHWAAGWQTVQKADTALRKADPSSLRSSG